MEASVGETVLVENGDGRYFKAVVIGESDGMVTVRLLGTFTIWDVPVGGFVREVANG